MAKTDEWESLLRHLPEPEKMPGHAVGQIMMGIVTIFADPSVRTEARLTVLKSVTQFAYNTVLSAEQSGSLRLPPKPPSN